MAGIIFIIGMVSSCEDDSGTIKANFEDIEEQTIYDYIVAGEDTFSSFKRILEAGGLAKTLSAYNPDNVDGYTLFLPDNEAVDNFIQNSDRYNSLDELLSDKTYAAAFSRYHVVNTGVHSQDFPFGALPELTLSEDYLTVSFVIEEDTSYYVINNQAQVVRPNIEKSNGYVHLVKTALEPVTFTSYGWLELNPGYSIFKAAVDLTGFKDIINIDVKNENSISRPFTMFVEHDSIYNKRGIQNIDDLIAYISPDDANYTDPSNALYNYVGYHILEDSYFIDDFVDEASNFSTYSDLPVNINGLGLDVVINPGKEAFDTIISGPDTTIIDYIGVFYDESNIVTQSGAIHFIDQVMRQQRANLATQTYQFERESAFDEFRTEPGEYLVEDTTLLEYISVQGSDLQYIRYADQSGLAWSDDLIVVSGDFSISYTIPPIVGGRYDVILGAGILNDDIPFVEVFIDGQNVGGLLEVNGTPGSGYSIGLEVGTVEFLRYESHTITIRTLIPGYFAWDYIRFEPFTN